MSPRRNVTPAACSFSIVICVLRSLARYQTSSMISPVYSPAMISKLTLM